MHRLQYISVEAAPNEAAASLPPCTFIEHTRVEEMIQNALHDTLYAAPSIEAKSFVCFLCGPATSAAAAAATASPLLLVNAAVRCLFQEEAQYTCHTTAELRDSERQPAAKAQPILAVQWLSACKADWSDARDRGEPFCSLAQQESFAHWMHQKQRMWLENETECCPRCHGSATGEEAAWRGGCCFLPLTRKDGLQQLSEQVLSTSCIAQDTTGRNGRQQQQQEEEEQHLLSISGLSSGRTWLVCAASSGRRGPEEGLLRRIDEALASFTFRSRCEVNRKEETNHRFSAATPSSRLLEQLLQNFLFSLFYFSARDGTSRTPLLRLTVDPVMPSLGASLRYASSSLAVKASLRYLDIKLKPVSCFCFCLSADHREALEGYRWDTEEEEEEEEPAGISVDATRNTFSSHARPYSRGAALSSLRSPVPQAPGDVQSTPFTRTETSSSNGSNMDPLSVVAAPEPYGDEDMVPSPPLDLNDLTNKETMEDLVEMVEVLQGVNSAQHELLFASSQVHYHDLHDIEASLREQLAHMERQRLNKERSGMLRLPSAHLLQEKKLIDRRAKPYSDHHNTRTTSSPVSRSAQTQTISHTAVSVEPPATSDADANQSRVVEREEEHHEVVPPLVKTNEAKVVVDTSAVHHPTILAEREEREALPSPYSTALLAAEEQIGRFQVIEQSNEQLLELLRAFEANMVVVLASFSAPATPETTTAREPVPTPPPQLGGPLPRVAPDRAPPSSVPRVADRQNRPLASQRQLQERWHMYTLTSQCSELNVELEEVEEKLLAAEAALRGQLEEEARLRTVLDQVLASSREANAQKKVTLPPRQGGATAAPTAPAKLGAATPATVGPSVTPHVLRERSSSSLLLMLEALYFTLSGGEYYLPSLETAGAPAAPVPSWSRLYVLTQEQQKSHQSTPTNEEEQEEAQVAAHCRASPVATQEANVRFLREALGYMNGHRRGQPSQPNNEEGLLNLVSKGSASSQDKGPSLDDENFVSYAPIIEEVCERFVRFMRGSETAPGDVRQTDEARIKMLEDEIKKKTHEWTVMQLQLRQRAEKFGHTLQTGV